MKKITILLIIATILITLLTTSGSVLAEESDSDFPPFDEGPNACRQNQMEEEAPNGPWEWQGG